MHKISKIYFGSFSNTQKHNFVKCGFLSSLDPEQAIQLQDQIWSISSNHFVQQPAISITKPSQALELNGKS